MTNALSLTCDGCGRLASPEHIARRLQRLEWSTRFRPIHIQTLFLGAFAPLCDNEFLYSPNGTFSGEAAQLLRVLNISAEGLAAEVVQAELQRAGAFLTHILECPLEPEAAPISGQERFLLERLGPVATRIRRSFRPKRVAPISREFEFVLKEFVKLDLGCPVLLSGGKPFTLENWKPNDFTALLQSEVKSSVAT